LWILAGCAASGTSRPFVARENGTKSTSNSAAQTSGNTNAQSGSNATLGQPANSDKPKEDKNMLRCNVSISRGKAGGSNKEGVARIELSKTQESSGSQLIRKTKANTIEWVESLEFSKEGTHPPATYDFEVRREDSSWCPIRIPVGADDVEKAVVLSLGVSFLP
jgi:hypothetical protein